MYKDLHNYIDNNIPTLWIDLEKGPTIFEIPYDMYNDFAQYFILLGYIPKLYDRIPFSSPYYYLVNRFNQMVTIELKSKKFYN